MLAEKQTDLILMDQQILDSLKATRITLTQLKFKNKALSHENTCLQAHCKELQKKLSKEEEYRSSYESETLKNMNLETVVTRLKGQLEEITQQLKRIQDQDYQDQIQNLKKENQLWRGKCMLLQSSVDRFSFKAVRAKEEEIEKQNNVESCLSCLRSKNNQMERSLAWHEEEYRNSFAQAKMLKELARNRSDQIQTLQGDLRVLRQKMSLMKDKHQRQIDHLQSERANVEEERSSLFKKVNHLQIQIESLLEKLKKVRQEATLYKGQHKQSHEQQQELLHIIEHLKEQYQEKEFELKQVDLDRAQIREERQQLQDENIVLRQKLVELQHKLTCQKGKLRHQENLSKEISEMRGFVQQKLLQELSSMQ